jgi:hypothetical protein
MSTEDSINAIKERLRYEVGEAGLALAIASAKHRELEQLCTWKETISDGTVTLREAQELHMLAAGRYRRAVQRLSDFAVESKVD